MNFTFVNPFAIQKNNENEQVLNLNMKILRLIGIYLIVVAGCTNQSGLKSEQWNYVVKQGDKVIGTEKVIKKQTEEGHTYYLYHDLPYNWFSEKKQCTIKVNRFNQVSSYEKECYYHSIRDIAVLEQKGAVNWQYFATNDVQEVTFYPNIILRQDFNPLDEYFAGLFQCLIDKYNFEDSDQQNISIFNGAGEQIIPVQYESGFLRIRINETEIVQVELDDKREVVRIYLPLGQVIEHVDELPKLVAEKQEFDSPNYITKEVKFESLDGTQLAGVLTLPTHCNEKIPALVLVGGTGPSSSRQGGIFSSISHTLGIKGIATLRYDKRGILKSGGNYLSHTHHELVSDAEGGLVFLSEQPEIDVENLAILGYSEGGVIASAIAARSSKLKACFIMAGPAVRIYPELAKIQTKQFGWSRGWSSDVINHVIAGIDANAQKLNEDASNWWQYGNRFGYVGWLRSLIESNPKKMLAKIPSDMPLVIFQGQQDSIVPAYQAELIQNYLLNSGHSHHEMIIFPELDHLFGKRIAIPECLPYQEYVQVDSTFLEILSNKISGTLTHSKGGIWAEGE